MAVRGYSNVAYPIYLVGALDAVSTSNTITVSAASGGAPADPTGWPATKPYFIAIDPETPNEEICLVTAVIGSSMDISRASSLGAAAFGSTTKVHQSGAKIVHVLTASDLAEANAHVNASQGVHGLAGGSSVVGTTDPQSLTNKTLSAATAVTGAGTVVSTTGTQTLTNKTLGAGSVFAAGSIDAAVTLTIGGQLVSTSATQSITGKTFVGPLIQAPIIEGATFKGGIYFDIRGYGAVGNGSTNDAAAIQAAADAAALVGGVVYVGGGLTYAQATTVRLPSYTQLYIAPGSTILRTGAVSMFIAAAAGQNIAGYGGVHDVWIGGGGTVSGNGGAQTTPNNVFTFAHCRNITLENISIADVSGYHALELNGTQCARVRNVKFLGYYANGAGTFRESIQIDLAKDAASTSVLPYDHTPCKDVLVTGCTFAANPVSGAGAPSSAFGGHSATVGIHQEDIRFVDNYCEGLTFWGASGYAWTRLTISRNQFINCAGGVRIDTIDTADTDDTLNTLGVQTSASQHERGFAIEGNHIYNCTGASYDAIRVFGEATGKTLGGAVRGNVVDTTATGGRGVNVFTSDRVVVEGNMFYATNGSAVYFDTSRDSLASNNIIVNPGGTGLFASGVIGFLALGNRINNSGGDGIQITSSSSYFTVGFNQILDAGTHGINVLTSCADFEVVHNMIRGASKNSAGVSSALRCSANCSRGTWAGNRTRRSGSVDYLNALNFTNTVTEMKRYGNNLQDGMNTSGVVQVGSAINDLSTSPDTSAADTTAA